MAPSPEELAEISEESGVTKNNENSNVTATAYGAVSQSPPSSYYVNNGPGKEVGGTSTVNAATLNMINAIIGAGVIGYGGAIAKSGGLISVVSILVIAVLQKNAYDLIVKLADVYAGPYTKADVVGGFVGGDGSFEDLGYAAYGNLGKKMVQISKFIYIIGSLAAYIVIFKDNFGPAMLHILNSTNDNDASSSVISFLSSILNNDKITTIIVATMVMLPLSLMRDVTPLAKFSFIKIVAFFVILVIVVYFQYQSMDWNSFFDPENIQERWLTVHGDGLAQGLGTFVFSLISQHTIHLVYQSLKPELRTSEDFTNWETVSRRGTSVATFLMVSVGVFVYMTFWENTTSNMFLLYQPSVLVDLARLLLSLNMLLTFPLPLFSCREMIIASTLPASGSIPASPLEVGKEASSVLPTYNNDNNNSVDNEGERKSLLKISSSSHHNQCWWLIPGEKLQLILPYHVLLTSFLYGFPLLLALYAPSLGDVLDLLGCSTGTGK